MSSAHLRAARKGSVLDAKAVETQGRGSVLAAKVVATQGKGSVLAANAVKTQGKGTVHTGAVRRSGFGKLLKDFVNAWFEL